MPKPLRLYYNQNVYRVEHGMRGKPSEIFQTGVELIGAGSLRGDLEIVEFVECGVIGLNFAILVILKPLWIT